jgi:hypothetical protein
MEELRNPYLTAHCFVSSHKFYPTNVNMHNTYFTSVPVALARRGRGEVYTAFWWGNQRERGYSEDSGVDGRILRWIFRKWDVGVWTGSIWVRIGTGSEHL